MGPFTCLFLPALKSLAEKEEFDMERVRLPNDADTERVKDGGGGGCDDVVGVFDVVPLPEPRREEEEPWRLRDVVVGVGSYMERVPEARLTEEVWVRVRLVLRRLGSVRSEVVRCISSLEVESHFLRRRSGLGILEDSLPRPEGVLRPESVSCPEDASPQPVLGSDSFGPIFSRLGFGPIGGGDIGL
jgi:hypothetical protein